MPANQPQQYADSTQLVVELTNRVRVLESKNSLLSERMLVINKNMIAEYKKIINDIKSIEGEIDEIKGDMNNIKNILKHLTEEARDFAKKDSLKILEKYINLWNPLHFVTQEEVQKIIKEELENHGHRTKHTH
ncbi:MAG: hypothetical protein U9Q69_06390 [Nanoarchaeota archaeon]|nr:hypothetical protein [Nanoarchaeota archaeon]